MVALGMRRPTRLISSDCNIPHLTIDDFETTAFPDPIIQKIGIPFLQNPQHLAALATMCIEKAKLCVCITNVLDLQYSSQLSTGSGNDPAGARHQKHIDISGVLSCDANLEEWSRQLPIEAQYSSWPALDDNKWRVLSLNRALLRLNYLTVISALHRPLVLSAKTRSHGQYDLMRTSHSKVRYSAIKTTEIIQQLFSRDLVTYLSTESVTVLVPAVIVHLMDAKSPDDNARLASIKRINSCMQVFNQLRETYAAAEYAMILLQKAIQKAQLQFPSEPEPPALPLPSAQSLSSGLTPPPDIFDSALPDFHDSDEAMSLGEGITPPASIHEIEMTDERCQATPFFSGTSSYHSPTLRGAKHLPASSSSTTLMPVNTFTPQSPIDQALTSLQFFDGIVMPYDDKSVIGSTQHSPAATITNWLSNNNFDIDNHVHENMTSDDQGENARPSGKEHELFDLDLDLMVDFATKSGDHGNMGLNLDEGVY